MILARNFKPLRPPRRRIPKERARNRLRFPWARTRRVRLPPPHRAGQGGFQRTATPGGMSPRPPSAAGGPQQEGERLRSGGAAFSSGPHRARRTQSRGTARPGAAPRCPYRLRRRGAEPPAEERGEAAGKSGEPGRESRRRRQREEEGAEDRLRRGGDGGRASRGAGGRRFLPTRRRAGTGRAWGPGCGALPTRPGLGRCGLTPCRGRAARNGPATTVAFVRPRRGRAWGRRAGRRALSPARGCSFGRGRHGISVVNLGLR